MSDLILHHYDSSPYAEKVRLMLGLKGLAWSSVEIPRIMPKPDLMPLTGGYRRTPVLQIGADIYCDTHLIAIELERRHPEPSLLQGGAGLAAVVSAFAEGQMFWTAAGFLMGSIADAMPDDFHQDRARMRGAAGADVAKLKAAVPRHREQLVPQLDQLADLLAGAAPFLAGSRAGLADLCAYHPLWFLDRGGRAVNEVLEARPALRRFMQAVADIGHGTRTALEASAALDIARAAEPATAAGVEENAEGWQAGDRVGVAPTDYGRDPVVGTLTGYGDGRISLLREDERVGAVAVHFPRIGFAIRRV